jgi:carboxypeptidase C (cathepsin A)
MADATATSQVPVPPAEQLSETDHQTTIGGRTIAYRATAGTLILRTEAEPQAARNGHEAAATIFFTAYTRTDVAGDRPRPLTFAFNGGPGSSSVWLHLGLIGPQRAAQDTEGFAPAPPFRTVENPHSLLDVSDLVFIDPVSTGFSRVVDGKKAGEFHGFKRDIEAVGDFISLYLSRYARWSSAVYLCGESYGTTRAAAVADYLQERHGLYPSGLMLISSVLQFQTLEFDFGNDLPYPLFLPTYTATAWYHGRLVPALQRDIQATLREVERFALGPYAAALLQGSALADRERERIAGQLARFTGLSRDYVLRSDLRIRDDRFVKELLRSDGRTVGRLDSRFVGYDRDAVGERNEYDPSYSAILGNYSAALNQYLRDDLQFRSDLPYEILNGRVWPWNYAEHQNRYVDVAETLRGAMHRNPHLRVYIAGGLYDLATPYFATQYTLNHLALAPHLRSQLRFELFPAGHMMYIQQQSLADLAASLRRMVETETQE